MKRDRSDMVEFLTSKSGRARSEGQPPPGKSTVPKSRQGKVGILTYHAPEVAKQLKMLAAETGMTQAQLVAKGLNVVFRTYGKPTIAAEQ